MNKQMILDRLFPQSQLTEARRLRDELNTAHPQSEFLITKTRLGYFTIVESVNKPCPFGGCTSCEVAA